MFITIFERAEDVHLSKDVGTIHSLLSKYLKETASILWTEKEIKSDAIKTKKIFDKIKLGKINLSILYEFFLIRKEINYCLLFHMRYYTFFYILWIKIVNPNAKIILKGDVDKSNFLKFGFLDRNFIVNFFTKLIFNIVKDKIDIVVFEHLSIKNKLEMYFKQKSLFYMPNGVDFIRRDFSSIERENIILHVARMGSEQKNSEKVLKLFSKLKHKNWKLVLVGPMTEYFTNYLSEFIKNHPYLKSRIEYKGVIKDREEMENIYLKSKIFILTSKWEGYPLSVVEASCFGLLPIVNENCGSDELLNILSYNAICENDNEYLYKINRIINNYSDYIPDAIALQKKVWTENNWDENLKKLAIKLISA